MIRRRIFKAISLSKTFSTELAEAATDAPSTSGTFAPGSRPNLSFVECVIQKFPKQLASLEFAVKEAEDRRKAALDPKKREDLLELFSNSVVSPKCRLIPVGSSVSGLASTNSDIDLAVFPVDMETRKRFAWDFYGNSSFKSMFMSTMASLIIQTLEKKGLQLLKKDLITESRVPLIKLEFDENTSIDIQFPFNGALNYQPFRNSLLIKEYAYADERFPQLYLWLRTVLEALEAKDSQRFLLSSYHCLLLTIHFLQSEQCLTPWPVLPVLCKTNPELVGANVPIEKVIEEILLKKASVDWQSKNKMPLSELIVRFVEYYSNGFDPVNTAIYIDRGLTQKRKQRSHEAAKFLLFDPYSNGTVCRSQYAMKAFCQALYFVRKKMKNGLMIDTFPSFEEEVGLFKEETKWAAWRTQREMTLKEEQKRAERMERVEE